ncbi:MAG: hypothetical protein GXP27_21415, partial [Planctomycetes bacterium]|nr:hypothetical protein [Planctomycetota bacterium]
TAARKIDRMRGPVVEACLRLRTWMDPEYLGLPLPGQQQPTLPDHDLDADLKFLSPDPILVDETQTQRRRVEADLRRLNGLIREGLLRRVAERLGVDASALQTEEHLRAVAVAYVADLCGVRSYLSAAEILREVCEAAPLEPRFPRRLWPAPKLRWMFHRYWRQHGGANRESRLAAWRAVAHNHWGSADVLGVWYGAGSTARSEGEKRLAELLRYPERISEQLVTMRAVQTLAILDVLHYREHVFQMGNYAADGESAEDLLQWEAVPDNGEPV